MSPFVFVLALFALNQDAVWVPLDELNFAGVVSAASFENKTVARVYSHGIPPKAYLVIYDYETKQALEVKDERAKLGIFSTIVPSTKSFFVVDNRSKKIVRYSTDGALLETHQMTHFEGAEQMGSLKMVQVSASRPGFGIAACLSADDKTLHYFLVDFEKQQIRAKGRVEGVAGRGTHIVGAGGQHYLIEPVPGKVRLFDLEAGKAGAAIYSDPHDPAASSYGGFHLKVVSQVTLNGAIYLHLNHYYDADGERRSEEDGPVIGHAIIEGTTFKPVKNMVFGQGEGKGGQLVFDSEEEEVIFKN